MSNRNVRNKFGLKDQIDSYRTIAGERYVAWMSYPSDARIAAYRSASVRCRRFGVELYVHEHDQRLASAIDRDHDSATGCSVSEA